MMRILHLICAVMVAAGLLALISLLADMLRACRSADDLMQVLSVAAAR